VRICLRALRNGHAIGIYPEGSRGPGDLERFHRGAAYLAMAAGAPVVPLVFLGTRLPGGSNNSVPPAGSRFVMSFGPVIEVSHRPWPRRQPDTQALSERIREAHRASHDESGRATGIALPGPIRGIDEEVL
jgi:1-acyl-sn-glycerol-3-phosphate acyltransferase